MSRILIAYYSRTGTTRELALQIADALGDVPHDFEEIVPTMNRRGLLGWVRCAIEGRLQRSAALAPSQYDPDSYDAVLIGTPTWASDLSGPTRAYLLRHRAALRRIAFFCTSGGEGSPRVFEHMTAACDRAPVATLHLRQSDVSAAASANAIERFAESVRAALEVRTSGRSHQP